MPLVDVLGFIEQDPMLSACLALKGGTAINLTIFDLPRLSVDIDLDYEKDATREIMLDDRERITGLIQKYMASSGYQLGSKSKKYHALDSFVFEYANAGGMKDNLKIEINYMLRTHIIPASKRNVNIPWLIWTGMNILTIPCPSNMKFLRQRRLIVQLHPQQGLCGHVGEVGITDDFVQTFKGFAQKTLA